MPRLAGPAVFGSSQTAGCLTKESDRLQHAGVPDIRGLPKAINSALTQKNPRRSCLSTAVETEGQHNLSNCFPSLPLTLHQAMCNRNGRRRFAFLENSEHPERVNRIVPVSDLIERPGTQVLRQQFSETDSRNRDSPLRRVRDGFLWPDEPRRGSWLEKQSPFGRRRPKRQSTDRILDKSTRDSRTIDSRSHRGHGFAYFRTPRSREQFAHVANAHPGDKANRIGPDRERTA